MIVAGNNLCAVEVERDGSVGPAGIQRRTGAGCGVRLHHAENWNQDGVEVIGSSTRGEGIASDAGEYVDQPFAGVIPGGSATEGCVFAHDVAGSDHRLLGRVEVVGVVNNDERIGSGVGAVGAAGVAVGGGCAEISRSYAVEVASACVLMLAGASLEGRVVDQV